MLTTCPPPPTGNDLRSLAQWPESPPDVQPFMHGWFFAQTPLQPLCGPDVSLVVELGSWMGKSARWLCRQCPNATVVCIDHWEGSPELVRQWSKFIPKSYDLFIRNLWEYRDRVVPLRMTTLDGISMLEEHGAQPDFVYVDAAHDEESVRADVEACLRAFPDAKLIGDDWNWESVQRGVRAALGDRPFETDWRHWWLV